jgi:hypothetical protein
MTIPAVTGEMPLNVWLRRQRETRSWTKRDTAPPRPGRQGRRRYRRARRG